MTNMSYVFCDKNGKLHCRTPECYKEVKRFKTIIKREGVINQERLKDALNLLKEIKEARREIGEYEDDDELSFQIVKDLEEEFNTLLNIQDSKGNTPLHYAVSLNQFEDVKTLIKYGADFLIQNNDEKIPLNLAQGGMKKLLIEGMKNKAFPYSLLALACLSILSILCIVVLTIPFIVSLSEVFSLSTALTIVFVPPAIAFLVVPAISAILYYTDLNYKKAKEVENTIDEENLIDLDSSPDLVAERNLIDLNSAPDLVTAKKDPIDCRATFIR